MPTGPDIARGQRGVDSRAAWEVRRRLLRMDHGRAWPTGAPETPEGASRSMPGVESEVRFRALLEQELRWSSRTGKPFAVLVFEIRSLGLALHEAVGLIRSRVRATDALGRLGSDGLGALLRQAGEGGASELVEELCEALAAPSGRFPRCVVHTHPPPLFRRGPKRVSGRLAGRSKTA